MSVATMPIDSTTGQESPVRWRGSGTPVPERVAREVADAVGSTYELLGARPTTSPALSVDDYPSAEATLQAATVLLTRSVDGAGDGAESAGTSSGVLQVLLGLTAAQRRLEEARPDLAPR